MSVSVSSHETNSLARDKAWFGKGILPGIFLALLVTGAAISAKQLPYLGIFSPMILAVFIGAMFSNVVGTPQHAKAGVSFAQKRLLRLAIVLLGFQLTFDQITAIGIPGLVLVTVSLVGTFVFTIMVGKALNVEARLTHLIAAGTSICGASAIVATNAVTNAKDEDVAYAVASITLFGTLAMLALPVLASMQGLDEFHFGIWAGAAIHEVAQVVGASFQGGQVAGETGTVTKLARVILLAPMVIALGMMVRRQAGSDSHAKPPMPWFVVAFAGVVIFNSLVGMPAQLHSLIVVATTTLLTLGLAAMGLQTSFAQFRLLGLRPLMLAAASSVFIAGVSLALLRVLY